MSFVPEHLRFTTDEQFDNFLRQSADDTSIEKMIEILLSSTYLYSPNISTLKDLVSDIISKCTLMGLEWGSAYEADKLREADELSDLSTDPYHVLIAFGEKNLLIYGY